MAENDGVKSLGEVYQSVGVGGVQMDPVTFIAVPAAMKMPASVILAVDFLKSNRVII